MKLTILKNYEAVSEAVAEDMVRSVVEKPTCCICLSAGETPRQCYSMFTREIVQRNIDISNATFVALDEWIGISKQNRGSCYHFLQEMIVSPLGIKPGRFLFFDPESPDLEGECRRMDDNIRRCGGIDLMIVGIGMNGHIGFNEPGVPFDLYSHISDLEPTTELVGQKYFHTPTTLKRGITLGLQHLSESRRVILLANGRKKAGIIRKTLEEEVSNKVPATIMRTHSGGLIIIDAEAAEQLSSPIAGL